MLVETALLLILLAVLALPFLIKKIEKELEIFLFVMGCAAVTVTAQWGLGLVKEALIEPIKITIAVLVAGFIFKALQGPIAKNVDKIVRGFGIKWFSFLVIVILGFLSSVITAIIAALVLVEIVSNLNLDRKSEIRLVILACFSIGMGAALTPIGEPLSTIAIAKLKGAPYHAGFCFLIKNLGVYIIPAIFLFGFLGMLAVSSAPTGTAGLSEDRQEGVKDVLIRTCKVYLFVMALVLLGSGFKPMIDMFISKIPYQGLYWINMISAILDNATLAAAEIGPAMQLVQIKAALLGLLISGGMLIPGNIPNIISAGKLKIKSTEWAKIGIPIGLIAMAICFFVLR